MTTNVKHFFKNGPTCNRLLTGGKLLNLSDGYQAIVDPEDFDRLATQKWATNDRAYVIATTADGIRQMHRCVIHLDPEQLTDHINGNGLDNRKENLRPATDYQNSLNRRKAAGLSSKYKGVSWHKHSHRWVANITAHGKHYSLGTFRREKDAALAYDRAALELHDEFARPNFSADATPNS